MPAGTTLRGYVQVNPGTNAAGTANDVTPAPIRYLGPVIIAHKDRPVRIKFTNALPPNSDFFLPVDTTVMGSGLYEIDYDPETKEPTLLNTGWFSNNRGSLHLHGGRTPWISDGTPHQWITPAGEATGYAKGVSVAYVPDMWFDANGNTITSCAAKTTCDGGTNNPGPGSQTYYYTNQQSARLMFYHDHAWGITRLNVYAGEAAGYLIRDNTELALINGGTVNGRTFEAGTIPTDEIPLIIQDKTFVDPATIPTTDPTWAWGTQPWTGDQGAPMTPVLGDLWWPHVYMPAQNPYNPNLSGVSDMGRWHYGPWFWPPTPLCGSEPRAVKPYCIDVGPQTNPYFDLACDPATDPSGFCQPPEIPGTPNPSWGAEAFLDTMVVNGTAYPTVSVQPKLYRLRILNASHDRFLNLQLYQAASKNGPTTPGAGVPIFAGAATDLTEVAMVSASENPDFPPTWPIDGREGGVPDPATRGPAFIQIGTEGGFLPAPVVLDNQPVTWNMDPTMFNVGNVNGGTLILGPAERADVIVDFSNFSGKTLILYNDAPTAYPALDPHYDYYTGAPDRTDIGGAPAIPAGVGPNVRTVMQITVAAGGGSTAPVNDYNSATLTKLENAFKSTGSAGAPNFVPGVFAVSQDPIVVGQKAYEPTYSTTFPGTWPWWGVSRISDNFLNFHSIEGIPTSVQMEPKAIHDEMGGTFDDYGRMSAKLGLEVPFSNAAISTFALQNFVDPSTEVVEDDKIQIWKITHNGVDTHPIHFHLFDVQVINRVGWDGFIRLPDPNELGWKDTVRMAPLEDTIVALRPIIPKVPFALPNSIRPLNPALPLGAMEGFSRIDPLTGNNQGAPVTNQFFNFGWEYVWHCHILSHEENDMMRPMVFAAPPEAPSDLVAVMADNGVALNWKDNSLCATSFTIERDIDQNFTNPERIPVGKVTSFIDTTNNFNQATYYRVFASNTVNGAVPGDVPIPGYPIATVDSLPSAPAQAGNVGLLPASLLFGEQLVKTTSVAQTLTLSNKSTAPLTINGMTFSGANAADFAQTNTCGGSLAANANCTIRVTFTPGAAGAKSASLVISSNDPINPTLTASLSGTGIVPIGGVAPASLSFGSQMLNTASAAKTVTLSNTGAAPLTISGMAFSGANAVDFAQTNTCGGSLAPNANCTISVVFTPGAIGARSASLDISSNDPASPALHVSLSGTGAVPIGGVAPASLAFGNQMLKTASAAKTVTLSNTGSVPLTITGMAFSGTNAADFAQTHTCG
ncbi:MAG: choice-of-anchor D domain-containing protein, partial [Pseudomonadota bacterium]